MYGGWPPARFKEKDANEIAEFYDSIRKILCARAPIEINEKSLMSSFMTTMMKMAQQSQVGHRGGENPLINVYESRASLKSALERGPIPVSDQMNDGVVVFGTTPSTTTNASDAKRPSEVDLVDVAMDSSSFPNEAVAKDVEPRDSTAAGL